MAGFRGSLRGQSTHREPPEAGSSPSCPLDPERPGLPRRPAASVLAPCEGEEGLAQVPLEALASVSGAAALSHDLELKSHCSPHPCMEA